MSPATVHKLADRIRTLPLDAKIDAIAHDVDGLEVLARQNAEAQRATGDAVEAIAESLATGLGTQAEHGARLEALECGVLEVLGIVRAEQSARKQAAADARASDAALAAQIAPVATDLAAVRAMVAPLIADTSRQAGNSASAKTAGAFSLAAIVTGLVAQPTETVKLLREIGPTGLAIAVALLLVGLVVRRRKP